MKVYVGEFYESDINAGIARAITEKAMRSTGLKYTKTKPVKRNGEYVGIKIWVCDMEEAFA